MPSSLSPTCFQVALPVPLRRLFDYLPPATGELPAPGQRVEVPFGRQLMTGIVVGRGQASAMAPDKLKTIARVLDGEPLLPPSLLALLQWAADYYQHPYGDALLSVLPSLLREGEAAALPTSTFWRLSTLGKGLPEGALKRSPQQAALLRQLQERELSGADIRNAGITAAVLRALKEKKLIESFERPADAADKRWLVPETAPLLNREQQQAVAAIQASEGFQTFLLQGITGSGKTEVYLRAIEQVLQQQRQALVLVPEIGLTPQTLERFQKRFPQTIVTLHSGLNDRERCHHWLRAARGEAAIVIGTRSAIFTPLPRLGIVIVDEEHDSSFKQQDGFRYHARDVAIVRAQRENIPVVLGSATPSLESLRNAKSGRYHSLSLTERAGGAALPQMRLLDINGHSLQQGFSPLLLEWMQQELSQGNQVLVFLNRRGYAPVLLCADCGWIAHCPRCDVRLTVHKQQRHLRCHHCDWQEVLPSRCHPCHSQRLDVLGYGTQRSEEGLKLLFPATRIIRIDRDSTSRKHGLRDLLQEIQQPGPAILLGTQMLAKGHHFPDVTLAVILDADSGIFSADFRSAEKTAQLLTQVAGRAGRAQKPGRVVIQSRFSEHPLMQSLVQQDYLSFARQLLREREQLQLPPYQQQVVLRCEAQQSQVAQDFLQRVRQQAEQLLAEEKPPIQAPIQALIQAPIQIMGPVPALMEKRADRFRHELVFSSPQRPALQKLLGALALQLESGADAKKVRWAMDVDPV